MNKKMFDAIVIGGGHAGVEATLALANNGFKVALFTLNKNKLAAMPCNPSIGGPAKGIITREIDALGGVQGYYADRNTIQVKMLNESKGPAVRALRAQIDKEAYASEIAADLEKHENVTVVEDLVLSYKVENNQIKGIESEKHGYVKTKVVIQTTGTYLDSKIFRGKQITTSGPNQERTSSSLSNSLKQLGFKLIRLKTGTPARIYTDSINFDEVDKEVLNLQDIRFSSRTKNVLNEQISCYLTYTNEETHKIIKENINESAMYSDTIKGIGPRYCPSIEDKIMKFEDKSRHQIFFEPETIKQDVMYINGLSTSFSIEVQDKIIRTIPGLKNANVKVYGYAIEYDAIDVQQLKYSLESKLVENLYFAGQINGTSGYEEAAAQGLIAGINAALKLKGEEPIIISRNDAYIGVLIDDLITKGTSEPYRMLTSRAEYRLLLRNDNVDIRLLEYAKKAGLLSQAEITKVEAKYEAINNEIERIKNVYISSKSEGAIKYKIENGVSLYQVLSRPDVDGKDFSDFEFLNELIINIRLKGYIDKQNLAADKMKRLENLKIPKNIDYQIVPNLATEARQKLIKIMPENIGQASRISGINPADIQMLLFYLNAVVNQKHEG
ncbi:tRNA uridine-5-carboxymethylaminomethyl(34) synthesis enzyme MnmG [Mycoplasmopsis agassizii]|uniref:tRNA uridine 5-carboxymethylaminomethyl modification enzyme MnmG n=1 Tax=Mycoplasmopsis agassizii TaxID=33922 RepID=A0ABX4H556_9BACT|nr:tRNA uridine-5-carboxymethylaminomethyl(34) synthesis enzyme MnmG [Mycoplasmopsis agassizii]PAF54942.1 tRNA uridine-5-carboxymethylaminomethyl(34) synthesis enzyme MnmG [Mycoplasmopsis agassizii]